MTEEEGARHSSVSVDCILVNYRSPWEMLSACLDSIQNNASDFNCTITVVDNASGDGIPERVRVQYPRARVIEQADNPGFAAAVNRGLVEASGEYVLLLNTDAVLTQGSLEAMVQALETAEDDCAGVSPKMMSSAHAGIIDAIGIVVPPSGAPFNRGIGQCDLGQYDRVDEVAGVCFGATLIKRSMFAPERVGTLHEDYFLYFEDSDWCIRALAQGYRFTTAPRAVVMHQHSGVTRHETLEFKYFLIELNTLKMVTRNFESRILVGRIVASRCARLLARTFIRRRYVAANLKVITDYLSALPRLLTERRRLRSKRRTGDQAMFRMSEGEDAFFDTVAYQPDRCLESLISSYRRLRDETGSNEYRRLLAALEEMRADHSQDGDAAGRAVLDLLDRQPPCIKDLFQRALAKQTASSRP